LRAEKIKNKNLRRKKVVKKLWTKITKRKNQRKKGEKENAILPKMQQPACSGQEEKEHGAVLQEMQEGRAKQG
jgi:hypothetical protein